MPAAPPDDTGPDPVSRLVERLIEAPSTRLAQARRALVQLQDERRVGALAAALSMHRTSRTAYARIVRTLCEIGADGALEALQAELLRPDCYHRTIIAHLAAHRRYAVLLNAIPDARRAVQRAIARTLAKGRVGAGVGPICRHARYKNGATDRFMVEALRAYGSPGRLVDAVLEDNALSDMERIDAIMRVRDLPGVLRRLDLDRHLTVRSRGATSLAATARRTDVLYRERTRLVRPAASSTDGLLLRPAKGVDASTNERLLRPSETPSDTTDEEEPPRGWLANLIEALRNAFTAE